MIGNSSLRRKVIYMSFIVGLLLPLYWLGQPSTGRTVASGDAEQVPVGGKLAQMRVEYGLAQSELGEIDAASESMKLATLGFRSVAANALWSKSIEYKKKEQWDKFSAALNQITKLQPNFYTVWEFQAHNLSYNISVEFDDYRHRYHWVKKGIDFLAQGTRYNRDEPRLFYKLGWYMGQKIGRSDETLFFRRLFREDSDFHASLYSSVNVDVEEPGISPAPLNRPDNWLVGKALYDRAYGIVDRGVPLRGHTRHLFFHSGPMSVINYSVAIGREGWFDMARAGWAQANRAYLDFGDRDFPTSWGTLVKLNNRQEYVDEAEKLDKQVDELARPGLRQELRQEKIDQLTPSEQEALDKDVFESRTEFQAHADAREKVRVRSDELALKVDRSKRNQALRLATEAMRNEARSLHVQRYREQVNYDYWLSRCRAEQRDEARQARELMHEADRHREEADLGEARRMYELAWDHWAKLYDEFPVLLDDPSASDVSDAVGRYLSLLELEGVDVPTDFKLIKLLKFHSEDLRLPTKYRRQIEKLVQLDDEKERALSEARRQEEDPSRKVPSDQDGL